MRILIGIAAGVQAIVGLFFMYAAKASVFSIPKGSPYPADMVLKISLAFLTTSICWVGASICLAALCKIDLGHITFSSKGFYRFQKEESDQQAGKDGAE